MTPARSMSSRIVVAGGRRSIVCPAVLLVNSGRSRSAQVRRAKLHFNDERGEREKGKAECAGPYHPDGAPIDSAQIQLMIKETMRRVTEGGDEFMVPEQQPLPEAVVKLQMKDLQFLRQNSSKS